MAASVRKNLARSGGLELVENTEDSGTFPPWFEAESRTRGRLTCASAGCRYTVETGSLRYMDLSPERISGLPPPGSSKASPSPSERARTRSGNLRTAKESSDQSRSLRPDTRKRSSEKGYNYYYSLNPSRTTQFLVVSRMPNWGRRTVVTAGLASDHLTAANAEQNERCTTVRRQNLGYEPERSMAAPAFRYCPGMVESDRRNIPRLKRKAVL